MATKKRSHSKKVVDAKFLNDLANEIHDPKKGTYLRLCTGTLQNGPDPKDNGRTMHCGLGELYFRMTGRQPETDGVNEDDVVQECLSRTVLADPDGKLEKLQAKVDKAVTKALKDLGLSEENRLDIIAGAVDSVDGSEFVNAADDFTTILNNIPEINDGTGCRTEDGQVCSEEDFELRSRRVAERLREAADLLAQV